MSRTEYANRLDLPGNRVWTAKDLADFLGVTVSWVYKRTQSSADAEDAIPRIPGIGRVRFDTWSPDFQAWIRRLGISEHLTN